MFDLLRQRIAVVLFVLLCGCGTILSLVQVSGWGNALSGVDRFSEANSLREVRNFLEQGLTRYQGLGNVYRQGMYSRDGFEPDSDQSAGSVTPEGVYTHYPPGPEYLLYAAARLFGTEPVSRLRLLPIAIGLAATLYLGFAVRRRFGAMVGWLVMSACVITPTVTDGFVGLHSQGYAAALMMVEIAIAIGTNALVAPFAMLGFLQGWLSFDYAFLVALAPLALELVMPRIDVGYERRWRLTMMRSMLTGAGFAFAHGLHFLQVYAYWGSLDATLHDFAGAAERRAGVALIGGPIDYVLLHLSNLKLYFVGLHPFNISLTLPDPDVPENWSMFRFLGLALGPWWLAVTLGLMLWDQFAGKPSNRALRMDWHFVCAIGMLTSSVWFLAMPDHAGHHVHFLYRHLFFAFFVAVLFIAAAAERAWTTAKPATLPFGRPIGIMSTHS